MVSYFIHFRSQIINQLSVLFFAILSVAKNLPTDYQDYISFAAFRRTSGLSLMTCSGMSIATTEEN